MKRFIYIIEHLPTGRKYVGCSKNPKIRIKKHLNDLSNGRHVNHGMQSDHGNLGDWAYSVLKTCDDDSFRLAEREMIQSHGYYNIKIPTGNEPLPTDTKPAQITDEAHEEVVRIKSEYGLSFAWQIQEAIKEFSEKYPPKSKVK